MRQTGLVVAPVVLLRRVAIRKPDLRAVIAHHIAYHLGRPAELGFVDDGLVAPEHPMIAIQALNADTGLITGNHFGLTQLIDDLLLGGHKRLVAAFQHLGQSTLAQLQPEHLVQHPGQPDKGNRLEGLQIESKGVQPGAKRRANGRRWQCALRTGTAVGAADTQPTMTPHKRRYRR